MKKLLLSTAIATSTLIASSALAQTTITGQLDLSYKMISDGITAGTANSTTSARGFGRESQINIQNKGKLNNGMDYAAGFSLEFDGQNTTNDTTTLFDENTYINFISGNTTVHFGQDHIQNQDRTLATFVGNIAEDQANFAGNNVATDIFLADVGGNIAQAFGAGIIQNVPNIGTFSALYVPSITGGVSASDESGADTAGESGYELGFVGSLGVKGLSTHAFYSKADKADSTTTTDRDLKGTNLGASYNFGAVTVGYNYKKNEPTANTTAARDIKQNEFGLAYAVSPNLTVAANYTKAEKNGTDTPADAESKSISVGYNLGPVALTAQAAKLEDFDGKSGTDADVLYLRASTKF
jgi:hypothetical protein